MDRAEAIEYLSPIAESATLPRYKEALGMAIAALNEQDCAKNAHYDEWISVKERMPEYGEVIAISPRYQDYLIGHLITCQEGTGVICAGDGVELEYVTHWMPLPEPPEGGAEK